MSEASDILSWQEQNRQNAIEAGMGKINAAFVGFTPEFYDSMQSATLASLQPQIARQYRATGYQLGSNLADVGLSRSSAAKGLASSLRIEKAQQEIAASNQAQQSRMEFEQSVQRQKGDLTNQLITSQNPTLAGQAAVQAASTLRAPSAIAPIGNAFSNWANIYLAGQMRSMMPQFSQASQSGGGGGSFMGALEGGGAGGTLNTTVGGI